MARNGSLLATPQGRFDRVGRLGTPACGAYFEPMIAMSPLPSRVFVVIT
jgi:hypothetical protein